MLTRVGRFGTNLGTNSVPFPAYCRAITPQTLPTISRSETRTSWGPYNGLSDEIRTCSGRLPGTGSSRLATG